ncbi:pyrimidine reductase family protein [Arthrobacter sp. 35/47]|uniref:pyrimidine reductase family protein n=1 Tax=Arthrobacter sp. 35/47 TaxID=269454 RepID=UPI0004B83FC7|nr:pyrimidine reductase family protein [Arthrobacter sp. 35/47]
MINSVLPSSAPDLSDEDLLALYAYPADRPWVRFNFVTSLDGSATYHGVSAPLGNDGDRRLFGLIRRLCDVILVGAGTVRAEGYAGPLVSGADAEWRTSRGLAGHPALAVISGTLDLDPESDLFRLSPVRPLIFTTTAADPQRARNLSEVADVVVMDGEGVGTRACAAELQARGLGRILCEGGPSIFGRFIAEDAADELCLSLSPLLTGGGGGHIAAGADSPALRRLALESLLESDSALYGRWVRAVQG